MMAQTLLDKLWGAHVVAQRGDGRDLLYIDRHVVHELHGPHALKHIEDKNRSVRRPDLTVAVLDHTVATQPGLPKSSPHIEAMREGARRHRFALLDVGDPQQGIVHVVSPELGIALPGLTLACPDSHASTVGALGTLAFGCGTSELEHVLATQVIAMHKPKQMRILFNGVLAPGVSAKDVALHLIRVVGVDAGRGYAVEYAGPAIAAMDIESRLTLCNLTIEWGARTSVIAPDDKTFAYCAGRPGAPRGVEWDAALSWWRTLRTDDAARFDREVEIDCASLEPQITWGTDPGQVVGVSERIPDPAEIDASQQPKLKRALDYMGLAPGSSIAGLPVDRVFIGSCANARLSDLRVAAAIVRGQKVAAGVKAIIVPGSSTVKQLAESEGLDDVFLSAGFEWRDSGCSMCAGANGDTAQPGERCVSTTNRNFENRQGRGVRTHLASPAMAAAAAIAGHIVDVRHIAGVES
jgi:3-isopropylmalate/(R)-2-methylmalate dehydratase large subunit